MSAAVELVEVLDREKLAAARADVEGLIALQAEKRLVLDRLRQCGAPPDSLAPIVQKARDNIGLMRQLVHCLRGVLGQEPSGYTSAGEARASAVRHDRGRV